MFVFSRRMKSGRKVNRPKSRSLHPRLEHLEDRLTPSTMQAISVADPTLGGGLGNSLSYLSMGLRISPNGRYVAFESSASNLVPGDTNENMDIFVRDTTLGTTTRVNTDSSGNQSSNNEFSHANSSSLAVDGSGNVFVAFESGASNLVVGDTNGEVDIFVKNLTSNVTTRVSTDSSGTQGNNGSGNPSLALDGNGNLFVAFESVADNLRRLL